MYLVILRRLLVAIPTLFFFSVLVFFFMHLAPGDPTLLYVGRLASADVYARTRAQLGLDEPLYVQYWIFLSNILRGNLGRSLNYRMDVIDLLKLRIPNSLILGFLSLIFAYALAIPLGILSAVKQGSILDLATMVIIALGMSMPLFWLGLMLVLFFSVRLGWFPVSGYESWRHLVLPVATLVSVQVSFLMRMVRSSMLEVLRQDYIRTARAKGLTGFRVIWRHALRNALIPLISILGMQIGWLVAGDVVIETVFVWPGVGKLIVDSIIRSDYPVIQGILLFLGGMVILGNLIADLLYRVVDPRIHL